MNVEWNAGEYGAKFGFVPQYGRDVMELIDAPKGSRVLDLGCGNGILTNALYDQGYSVIGLDASESFLETARKQFPNLTFMKGDALQFSLPEKVDVVFSNAVFHWIDREDQPQLLQRVSQVLKRGGELVCEFGGLGNNQRIHQALSMVFHRHGRNYQMPFFFPSIGAYTPLVEQQGMKVTLACLFDRPTELEGENGMESWIRMFVQRPFENIGKEETGEILIETVNVLRPSLYVHGKWYADYVRLRLKAIRV